VGKTLALVILYEIHDINCFPTVGNFISYARLVKCTHESGGKRKTGTNNKIGNVHLKWAFIEAACLLSDEMNRESFTTRDWSADTEKPRLCRFSPRNSGAPYTPC
jgi:transposase